jgi:dTDP-4-dehydrorhamnose reductase
MIFLLGSTGYIGSAFARELCWRGAKWLPLLRREYTDARLMLSTVGRGDLVINCAAFIPKRSVQDCDLSPAETIKGNTLLPAMLATVCEANAARLAHISTGCLWSDGKEHTEDDPPQRAFTGHCGFYIGTKVLAEEAVRKYVGHYILRVRLPFDNEDSDRNYLSKLITLENVWVQKNSACHRQDFVKACLDLLDRGAPFGTYNMTNPGVLDVTKVVAAMISRGITKREPNFIEKKDGECQLSCAKLLSTGVKIRDVYEAVDESLSKWIPRKVTL